MSHHLQRGFKAQLEHTKQLIIQHGGLNFIEKELGLDHFIYFLADTLGCQPRKAKEYIYIVKRSTLAANRLKKIESGELKGSASEHLEEIKAAQQREARSKTDS